MHLITSSPPIIPSLSSSSSNRVTLPSHSSYAYSSSTTISWPLSARYAVLGQEEAKAPLEVELQDLSRPLQPLRPEDTKYFAEGGKVDKNINNSQDEGEEEEEEEEDPKAKMVGDIMKLVSTLRDLEEKVGRVRGDVARLGEENQVREEQD